MELQLWIASCRMCEGKKTVDNPAWQTWIKSLTPQQLAGGVTNPKAAPVIACTQCGGLGAEPSPGVIQLFELYDRWKALQQEKAP
jgi:hypothetical protein